MQNFMTNFNHSFDVMTILVQGRANKVNILTKFIKVYDTFL